jgi:hypothetical protein
MSLTPLHRPGSRQAPSPLLRSGSYLTDGRSLFRVVSQFTTVGEHAFASLEDCLTLEVHAYAPGELHKMGLRLVRTTE